MPFRRASAAEHRYRAEDINLGITDTIERDRLVFLNAEGKAVAPLVLKK